MKRATVARWLGFAAFWLALTGAAPSGIVYGIVAVTAATVVSVRLLPPDRYRASWITLLLMVPRFLWHSLVAGVDVARRAFDPRLPLRTGYVRYPVNLPGSAARNAFAALTSLQPGTVPCADEDGALVYHCLDVNQPVAATLAAEEARFARVLREVQDA